MLEKQNVQVVEVRELTDGVWDGPELVVGEPPVRKENERSESKGAEAR
jgi:hypothetical protein